MKLIPLRNRAGEVVAEVKVDDEDFADLDRHKWCKGSHGYAKRSFRIDGWPTAELLHRRIMGLEPGDGRYIDHINRDKLDCRKQNMRLVTQGENMQNQGRRGDNKSGFRGVWRDESRGKWEAYARVNGRRHHLGRYDTAEAAAAVASDFRVRHMPCSPDALAASFAA